MDCQITALLIRCRELSKLTGLSRSSIYYRINSKSPYFDPTFPQPVRLSPNGRAVAWCKAEVLAWIESRLMAR